MVKKLEKFTGSESEGGITSSYETGDGIKLKVPITKEDTTYYMSVDTAEDLERANENYQLRSGANG